jgi:hypothetical protein
MADAEQTINTSENTIAKLKKVNLLLKVFKITKPPLIDYKKFVLIIVFICIKVNL